jgi:hypothetical protein
MLSNCSTARDREREREDSEPLSLQDEPDFVPLLDAGIPLRPRRRLVLRSRDLRDRRVVQAGVGARALGRECVRAALRGLVLDDEKEGRGIECHHDTSLSAPPYPEESITAQHLAQVLGSHHGMAASLPRRP